MPANVVLGSFDQLPDFVEAANSLDAIVLKPSQFLFAFMEKFGETWTLTRSFLDGCIARRRIFLLLTPPVAAIRGSSYMTELRYLRSKGVPESSFRLALWEPKPAEMPGTVNRFGWNALLARKHRQLLTEAIQQELRFLFAENGAQIIPDDGVPFPPKFDYAFVTLAVDNIRLRFVRGRDDLSVSVAAQHRPHDFCELSLLLMISESSVVSRRSYSTLSDAARLLKGEMGHLEEELSNERADRLQERLRLSRDVPLAEQLRAID
jgi:hypothetical protein